MNTPNFDVAPALIGEVARRLLGEPNKRRSTKMNLRFGSNGSLSVNTKMGTWFSHEDQTGGGILDLIERETGAKQGARFQWLVDNGLAESKPKANGKAKPRSKASPSSFNVVATYDYTDAAGVLRYQVCRLEPKDFRQRQPHSDKPGNWLWNMKGVSPLPYRLPQIVKAIERGDTIAIVEGEKDADNLAKLGIEAACNHGGSKKWWPELTPFFKDANVVLVGDNDQAGRDHVNSVAKALAGTAASIRALDLVKAWPECPEKGDVSDWVAAGATYEDILAHLGDAPAWVASAPLANSDGDEADEDALAGMTQADILIRIATDENVELFKAPDDTAYAAITINGHKETHPIKARGGAFKRFICAAYYVVTKSAPNSEALASALRVIEAKALFDGKIRDVYLRIANLNDEKIYIDIGDADWRAIEVDAAGWRIVGSPPVHFRRAPGMRPLAVPVAGGTVDELAAFITAKDDAFKLTVGFMLSALRGRKPYPIAAFSGEQGSAKSTSAAMLRRLIDPNSAPLRSMARNNQDLAIAANNGHVVAFDNLSGISGDMADALCRLSTGGGFSTRMLYTDDEESLFDGARPVVLTSIGDVATRSDLADRSIMVQLGAIPDNKRRAEAELWSAFDAAAPRILGALLDMVAHGIKNLPNTKIERLPRMADHALWVAACETKAWPAGEHLKAYSSNRMEAVASVLDADPIAHALRQHLESRPDGTTTTTTADLLATLSAAVPEHVKRHQSWPATADGLRSRLRKLAPALRRVGVTIEHSREGRTGRRLMTITGVCR